MAVRDPSSVDVRRAGERSRTRSGLVESWHSFSFGPSYDPANTHHGLLVANNEHVVPLGAGFAAHPHRDMEIVTWVLQGSLVHEDSTGRRGLICPGLVQRMSAGTGIVHSERNEAAGPAHFVQMWLLPDESALPPSYEQREVDDALLGGALVPIASGLKHHGHDAVVHLHNRHAGLLVARLQPGQRVRVPDAPFVHVYVGRGAVDLEGHTTLADGDAARFTFAGAHDLIAREPAEVLVWEMHAAAP